MNPVERDDFLFELRAMVKHYGKQKDFEDYDESVWLRVVGQYGANMLRLGIQRHYEEGKFMPQPSEIRKLIKLIREENKGRERPATKEEKKGSKTLTKAWLCYMKFAHGYEGPGHNSNLMAPQYIDKALEIVNRHCQHEMNAVEDMKVEVPDWVDNAPAYIAKEKTTARQVIFDSIKDDHKLEQYW